MRERAWWAAAAALVGAFVASRAMLVVTSYDAIANWEEPVFLYSAVQLGRDGIGSLFDHQDDLSHGGSLPLLLIAKPWTALFGMRLDALKGVAIAWSAATLLLTLLVGRRFVSGAYGLLVALLYTAASAHAAQLQATLVGSHPESSLPCVLAIGLYWRSLELEGGAESSAGHDKLVSAGLGAACALAVWTSYLAAALAAPLLAFHLAERPRAGGRAGRALAAAGGLAAGTLPWIVQNVWLRPHGAMQWLERVGHFRATGKSADAMEMLERMAKSFGFGEPLGAVVLFALLAPAATAVVASLSNVSRPTSPPLNPRGTLPLAAAVALGFAGLVVAQPDAVPDEGYFYYRFYTPLQTSLFWLAGLAIPGLPDRVRRECYVAAFTAAGMLWIAGQAPLYGRGHTYTPELARDLGAGCSVFGHAEVDRAASLEQAVARLEAIDDEGCRRAALNGYGLGIVSRYARDGDVHALASALAAVSPPLRPVACNAAQRLIESIYEEAMTEDRRRTGAAFVEGACR